jgi:hypothetical protein
LIDLCPGVSRRIGLQVGDVRKKYRIGIAAVTEWEMCPICREMRWGTG